MAGCAGSYDERYKRVTRAFVKILEAVGTNFAVLGAEETCTGDPARRAGNEFLFQMQAMNVIQVLNSYQVKRIVTACPHCFNTLKNEYPDLGGSYEVIHHSTFLQQLIQEGKIKLKGGGDFKGKKIVIVAGSKSHGSGDHEFFAGSVILMNLLKQTDGVWPVLARDGWPKNEKIFEGAADAVIDEIARTHCQASRARTAASGRRNHFHRYAAEIGCHRAWNSRGATGYYGTDYRAFRQRSV